MGVLNRYGILFPSKRISMITVPVFKEEVVDPMEVYLEDDTTLITRSNSEPGVKDYLIHNIAQYRREDTNIRLLPATDIMLDLLLVEPPRPDEEIKLY